MKPVIASLIVALLAAGASACGATGGATSAASERARHASRKTSRSLAISSPPGGYLHNDGDKDTDDAAHKRTSPEYDASILFTHFRHRAGPADRRAVTALVKSYYATSAAGDGAKACSLLTAVLAEGLGAGNGHSADNPRSGCAAAMTALLAQQRSQLAVDDVPTMVVTTVRVNGDLAVAALGFRKTPESEILVERKAGTWKIDGIFAVLMP